MESIHLKIATIVTLLFILTACVGGGGELRAKDAWARPAKAGGNGAVYLTIVNPNAEERTLTGVTASVEAKAYEIHQSSIDENEIMRMEPLETVVIPANSELTFAPGSIHIMVVGLKQDLIIGEQIEITLKFQNGEKLSVFVVIEAH